MKIRFLGTGGSEGIPCLRCSCLHCEEARKTPHFRRAPTSVLIKEKNEALLIDAGFDPGFLLEKVSLQGILLTHWHADHWAALPRLSWAARPLPFLCPEPEKTPSFIKRGLVPLKKAPFDPENWGIFQIYPLPLKHSVLTWGYLIKTKNSTDSVAILWDTKGLPSETLYFLRAQRPKLAIVDATYPPNKEAQNHNNVLEAANLGLAVAEEVYLTHFSHQNWPPLLLEEYLSSRFGNDPVALAFDGLEHQLSHPLRLSLEMAKAI